MVGEEVGGSGRLLYVYFWPQYCFFSVSLPVGRVSASPVSVLGG